MLFDNMFFPLGGETDMKRFRWGIAAAMCLVLTGICFAQRTNRPLKSRGGGLNDRFSANSPKIGEPLPDISVYAEDGTPFPLRRLKGKHTVLVFGCLT